MITKSKQFASWWADYQRTRTLAPVQLGMARENLRSLFGEPDATGQDGRRNPEVGIWRFGSIEFHFGTDGRLFLVYTEDKHGTPTVIAKSDPT